MPKGLIENIVNDLKNLESQVLLVENNDGFLQREDLRTILSERGFAISNGTQLEQRVAYETRDSEKRLILLSLDYVKCLEDVESNSKRVEFFLDEYLHGYHINTVIDEPVEVLEKLYEHKQIIGFNKVETQQKVMEIRSMLFVQNGSDNLEELILEVENEINNNDPVNWDEVAYKTGRLVREYAGTKSYKKVLTAINRVNEKFQLFREAHYNSTKNSSATKLPKNVCKILDYLDFNFKQEKIALIVVDGMGIWQYEMLSEKIEANKVEKTTLSWIPSITQLSRQAIFRGDIPEYDYRQGPKNEEKLWKKYWIKKGIPKHQIAYKHSNIDLSYLSNITRLAIVYKELDGKMHGNCDDFVDLKSLTQNWIERSGIVKNISKLLSLGFTVFVTSDHGNIEAEGWRGLTSREKLGQKHKSGSRGERHLEYSEKWLYDEFLENNEDILDAIVKEDQAIYFKNNQSFSRREKLVTHGGAHFLEVVIPFVQINNDK